MMLAGPCGKVLETYAVILYCKCPIISYPKFSDKMIFANSADSEEQSD